MFPYSCACLIFWVWVCLLYSLHVSLVWPFKGKAKDREAKERQLNGHQFATGSCLGPTVCLICEKPASGRDLLHCSSRSRHSATCTTLITLLVACHGTFKEMVR